jgi:non-specific serine/threonine protein kinase
MERWVTIKRLHQAALDREAGQRSAFLDDACGGDETVRREVESLLAYDDRARPFMEAPAIVVAAKTGGNDTGTSLAGKTLGHFHVEAHLGAGGMGEVYLARDARLDRAVALKVLPPDVIGDSDRMQRFAREARAASALNHPNVATIHDIGETDSVHFIVMEYVEGQTLAQRLAEGPLTMSEVVDVATQVADALEVAHGKGITHRDIKPANLMLTPRGQVKVLDFGIAKTAGGEAAPPTQVTTTGAETAVGLVIGSVPYMSPEQVLGRVVDHRSDLFSLGVTLYELATGRHPFAGATATETMDRILHAIPERMVGLDAAIASELERITLKCLQKNVTQRYQSARELLADLRQLRQTDDSERSAVRDERRHNLPAQLTTFIGRRHEIDEIERLFASTRLLTLTGAGGCGKTRLALQVASEVLDQFSDGVWIVDLAPLSEPALIPQTIAAILGVRDVPNRPLRDGLAEYFRARCLLLVLDNCEHLIAACARLVEPLLRVASNLHVLATSREGLGIGGETVWRVPSLSVPEPSDELNRELLQQYEAVRLFADRAAAVAPAFAVTEDNATTVAAICRRLDGIPLAIELAAARLNVLSVDQINARLNDRFRLLTGGSRTALARQRTLEAAIDWSYDLLSETESTLLCRLSVFPGGWTLEAAEDVCAGHGIESENMLDLLSHLVDKSLVNVEDDARGERRYRCLETVRQYGRERLVRSGDAERARDRHLDFFSRLVRRAEPELRGARQVAWLNRLQLEHDNLRAALDWCLAAPEHGETGLELGAALNWFWFKRGHVGEARQWLERVLSAGTTSPAALRAKALDALGWMAAFQGDFPTALAQAAESMALAREAGDWFTVAEMLFLEGFLAVHRNDVNQAIERAAACRDAASASGDLWIQAHPFELLGFAARLQGHYEDAAQFFGEALALFRRSDDMWAVSRTLTDLGQIRVLQGHFADAKAFAAEGVILSLQLGDVREIAWYLEIFAATQAAQGNAGRAARLWGALDRLLESVGVALMPEFTLRDPYLDGARESLGESAFQDALSEGRAMSLRQAVQYALAD